jgi:transposase
MEDQKRYSPELKERAVGMVLEHGREYASQWSVIMSISSKIGCTAETLRRWVRLAQVQMGHRGGLNRQEQERLKELEHENRELRRVNEILRKASAFFAQAELDRRRK